MRADRPLMGKGKHLGAELMSVTDVTEGEYGPGTRFSFLTADRSAEAVKTTSTKFRVGGALANWVGELRGTPVEVDEEIDLQDFVGKKFDLVIGDDRQIAKISPAK